MPEMAVSGGLPVENRRHASMTRRPGTRPGVRWDSLFDDLEGQLEAADSAEFEAELRERERAERARLRVVDRLRGAHNREIDVALAGGHRQRGTLRRVGADFVLLDAD